MEDLKSWIWGGFGLGLLVGLLGAVYFLTQPEKLALFYPSGVSAPDPAFGLGPSPLPLKESPDAPRLALQAAPAAPAPRPVETTLASPSRLYTQPESRSSASVGLPQPAQLPARQLATYQPPIQAGPQVSRPLGTATVQYGRVSRDRLMGRSLSPVHNLGESASGSPAPGGKIQPRGFTAEPSAAQTVDSTTQQINQLRQGFAAKSDAGSVEAMRLLNSVSDKLQQAKQAASQTQDQDK